MPMTAMQAQLRHEVGCMLTMKLGLSMEREDVRVFWNGYLMMSARVAGIWISGVCAVDRLPYRYLSQTAFLVKAINVMLTQGIYGDG